MPRGMLCLTTPTCKQKLLSFGIIQAWYHLLPPSFLPTSASSLQQNCLAGGFSWTYPAGHYLWMICLVISLGNSQNPSLTGITPSVLHSSRSLSRAEVISSLHAGNFYYSRVLSYVICSSRTNQMQHVSALPLGFKKSKERKSRLFILSCTEFFM